MTDEHEEIQPITTENLPQEEKPEEEGEKTDSGSSDSDSDSDGEYEDIKRTAEQMLQQELDELNHQKKQPRTQHELTTLPPVEKVTFEWGPQDTTEVLGQVHHIMDDLVVIKAQTTGKADQEDKNSLHVSTSAIEEGSVLCLADRTLLGQVFEIFGPVRQPFYSIRFNNSAEIPAAVALGVDVYFPVQRCARIFAAQIYSKGCDASDEFNEEVPEHLQDYSDDEEEQRARTTSKKAKRKRSAQRAAEATIGQRQVVEYDEFATESLAGPPSRDPPPKIQKTSTSISVQEILDKNTEGELTRTNDTESADVVGFFEPLPMDETNFTTEEGEEYSECTPAGDVARNKSVLLSKKRNI